MTKTNGAVFAPGQQPEREQLCVRTFSAEHLSAWQAQCGRVEQLDEPSALRQVLKVRSLHEAS